MPACGAGLRSSHCRPPTAFALLHYLVTHAGQLVTKDEFYVAAIWAETVVSEAVLKVGMGEVRKALGETARAPRWIATVHRRGYRFVAPVTRLDAAPGVAVAAPGVAGPPCSPMAPTLRLPTPPRPTPPRPGRGWSGGRGSWRSSSSGGPGRTRASARWSS